MTEIYLNIYDLSPANYYLHSLGVGIYHTGIQIGYNEYCYGFHTGTTTGVSSQTPRVSMQEGVQFRESVLLGKTQRSKHEIDRMLDDLKSEFIGNQYDLLGQNCNSFSNAVSQKFLGKPIPRFINRAAGLGNMMRCCIPKQILGNNGGDPMNQDPYSTQNSFNSQSTKSSAKSSAFSGKGTTLGGVGNNSKSNPYHQVGDDSL